MSEQDMQRPPHGLIAYGPQTNCTVELCGVEWSVLGYRPSTAASGVFIGLFSINLILHLVQGIRWKTWSFMVCMLLGCFDEILGYIGRIMLYNNPFSFGGFLIDMICITTAPVFYCAAIYVTLARTINFLDPSLSRFNPKFLYWFFIPIDVVSLALQAGGGASSSVSSGSSQTGLNVSLGGLSLQVVTLVIFVAIAVDYLVRYYRVPNRPKTAVRFKVFLVFLSVSILLILGRCVYRIDELKEGYAGELFREEKLFYGFESVFVVVAVFCLNLGHPGLGIVATKRASVTDTDSSGREDKLTAP